MAPDSGEMQYVDNDGVHLAYRVLGRGEPLLLIPNFATNIEAMSDMEVVRPAIGALASMFRLISYDQRGTGLSDHAPAGTNTLDDWVSDAEAVLDAAGAQRALVFGLDFSGPIAIEFAARHPDRTAGLVLWGTYAALTRGRDADVGIPPALRQQIIDELVVGWGDPESAFARLAAPGDGNSARLSAARVQRQSMRPGQIRPMIEAMFDIDVRDTLPAVRCRTLILHRAGDQLVPVGHARYLSRHMPDAELVELPGDDHFLFVGDTDRALAELARFAQVPRLPDDEACSLAVVMFVDVVESTVRAAALGDRQWRQLLDGHDQRIRDDLTRFGGQAVNWTGDGVLAVFVSPTRAVRCARAIVEKSSTAGLAVRVGIHAGEVQIRSDGIAGIAVHIAQRIEGAAGPGQVLVSGAVRDLVEGSDLVFVDGGEHELKGIAGPRRLYALATES